MKSVNAVLQKVFYDTSSPACYAGLQPVYREAKKRLPSIKISDVKSFLQEQDVYTLHKPIRRKFPRNKTVAVGIDSDWQADLCDVWKIKKYNDGYCHILTVIDVLSKFAWAVPIKNKKPETVAEAFKQIIKTSNRKPWRLYTDKGLEFRGMVFQNFLQANDIQYISSESPDVKAAVAERYNRTLKTRLWKHFTRTGSYRYIEVLPLLVHAINSSYHRSIKRRPIDVNNGNEKEVWNTLYGKDIGTTVFKFNVGDKVRIAQEKHIFKKGYLPNFTEEIFTVEERLARIPPVYKVKDYSGESIVGIFYEWELVKVVKPEEIYKIEKILKTRKRKGFVEHFVKWFGYPDKFNQWIKQTDLKTI
ncbi:MAG: hypothetical protein DRQ56_04475 [Gammaproteobacteria bacterium]|nr:MAG: hypothetical protein DRQ56_04475 [Gammaproteobacteria bacterium]